MIEEERQYDDEFKKNAVKLSYASPKTVKHVADDLGISGALLYRWRKKCTADGDKTRYPTLEEKHNALKLELAEVKMERERYYICKDG